MEYFYISRIILKEIIRDVLKWRKSYERIGRGSFVFVRGECVFDNERGVGGFF